MDQSTELQKIDLMKYLTNFLRALRKYWFIVLLSFVLAIGLCEARELFFFRTTYTSQAVFVPSQSDTEITYYSDTSGSNSDGTSSYVSTFNSLITGSEMREVIKDVLHTDTVPATISASVISGTNLVQLRVTADNPDDAYNVANVIVNNYYVVTANVMDVTITLLDNPTMPAGPDAYPDYLGSGLKGALYGLVISFDKTTLDRFTQWKMMGEGEYVLGLEPGNCTPDGRHINRRDGILKFIDPNEEYKTHLEIKFTQNTEDIQCL